MQNGTDFFLFVKNFAPQEAGRSVVGAEINAMKENIQSLEYFEVPLAKSGPYRLSSRFSARISSPSKRRSVYSPRRREAICWE